MWWEAKTDAVIWTVVFDQANLKELPQHGESRKWKPSFRQHEGKKQFFFPFPGVRVGGRRKNIDDQNDVLALDSVFEHRLLFLALSPTW
jgi:hypothetical protein